jgi:hypothetical protein
VAAGIGLGHDDLQAQLLDPGRQSRIAFVEDELRAANATGHEASFIRGPTAAVR